MVQVPLAAQGPVTRTGLAVAPQPTFRALSHQVRTSGPPAWGAAQGRPPVQVPTAAAATKVPYFTPSPPGPETRPSTLAREVPLAPALSRRKRSEVTASSARAFI